MFTVAWADFSTGTWRDEIVFGQKHLNRMIAELRQLGVKWIVISETKEG